ncbi:FAD-dependent oxidoreductase [Actinomycetospora sp. NBRC 106378]|uniref:FAD-dependent oxidoreductase n=1 Tax=Actinomycetospora sp. NBRC 106378 TaxID=3032208 RepID=UPI0024A24785|nr:FAD-dependent oxidoreductase [Actinomycetospora sp. NBRC 106378]GLZ55111.1 NADH oxidase [Actinomycetospora sp. NBRC 106378]
MLGEPIRVGTRTVRNRIVFPAHLTNAAVQNRPSAQHAAYYAARAAGGVGLIIVEEQALDRPYEKAVLGTDPAVVPGYRAITDAVHAHGAVVLAQVGHNGAQSSSLYSREPVEAPSPVPDPMFREVPVALDAAGIAEVVRGFATVARHCVAGGFDGVEIQGSQASLVRQFLSPLTNHRTDRYADGVVFLREVLTAVRAELGDRVLGVRLQGDEGLDGGLTAADAARVAVRIADLVDVVNTAVGVATATLPLIEPPMGVPAGYAEPVPDAVRAALAGTGVPVIGVGRYTTSEQARRALETGACDLVGVVRGQIADPAFAAKALAGERVRRCIGCNQECIAAVGLNRWLGCLVNPDAGRESVAVPVARSRRRVLVVGGGPAGLAAAAEAAERGHDVHLVERSDRLGGQLALAAAAPERRELAHAVADLAHRCRDAGVWISLRTEVRDAHQAGPGGSEPAWRHPRGEGPDHPDVVIVATGARPDPPSGTIDVTDVLAGTASPSGRVLVVDDLGGPAAPSVAELLAQRGSHVRLVTSGMVAAEGLGPVLERERWRRRVAALGVELLTDRVLLDGALLHHPSGRWEPLDADAVVHAGPRMPAEIDLAGTRVGDVLAPRDAAAAIREGTDAARAV